MPKNRIIITSGKLFYPGHSLHQKTISICVEDGIIQQISESKIEENNAKVFDARGCEISIGRFDLRCHLGDPGYEYKEDLESGCMAAAAGGYTGLAVQPDTDPVIQTKSMVEYLNRRSASVLPLIIPVGAATQDLKSEDITEVFDMYQSGARAFSNGDHSYKSGGSLMRLLQYSSSVGGLIMSHPIDHHLAGEGMVNESETTIHTGLKQQASLAETVQIAKEIEIARYAGNHIHFSHISTADSVELIRRAKKSGYDISCDVSIWHLIYNDTSVLDFDSNFKMNPPLREERDRLALIKGLNDGTIDVLVSDHHPQNIENKALEFDYAAYGAIGLQTLYSLYIAHLEDEISKELFWKITTVNPRKLLKIEVPEIAVGMPADLIISNPDEEWQFNKKSNFSRSMNSPVWNQNLKGKCVLAMRGEMLSTF